MPYNKYSRLLLCLFTFCLLPNAATFAETIFLKSGQTIEAKIIEKTDKYIKIDFEGVTLTYFWNEIEKIEDAKTATATQSTSQDSLGELYVNEEYGFEIRGPKGWFKHTGASGKAKTFFTKQPVEGIIFPAFGITTDIAPEDIHTALDFTKLVLPEYQASAERTTAAFRLAEPPHEIEVNGIKGARFIFEMIGPGSKEMKSIDCKFMRDNLVVSLQGMDYPATFQTNLKDFEEIINGFKFLWPTDDFAQLKKLNQVPIEFKPIDPPLYESLKNNILENMQTKNSYKSIFILRDKTDEKLAKNDFIGMEMLMTYISSQSFEFTNLDHYNNWGDIWRVDGNDLYNNVGAWVPQPETGNPEVDKMMRIRKEAYKMLSFDKYLRLFKTEIPVGIAENIQGNYTVIKFNSQQVDELFTGRPRDGVFISEVLIWVDVQGNIIRFVKTIIGGKDKGNKEIKEEYEHYFSNYNAPFKLGKPDIPYMEEKK